MRFTEAYVVLDDGLQVYGQIYFNQLSLQNNASVAFVIDTNIPSLLSCAQITLSDNRVFANITLLDNTYLSSTPQIYVLHADRYAGGSFVDGSGVKDDAQLDNECRFVTGQVIGQPDSNLVLDVFFELTLVSTTCKVQKSSFINIVVPTVILVVAAFIGGIVFWYFRRRIKKKKGDQQLDAMTDLQAQMAAAASQPQVDEAFADTQNAE
jgi:hypothetical protein